MSRVAKSPVTLPAGVDVTLKGQNLVVKGGKGSLELNAHQSVELTVEDKVITFAPRDGAKQSRALAGTTRSLVNNMVVGVSQGFEKKLLLQGVGYRAAVKGNVVSLSLGFSHPVDFEVPAGVTVEAPSQTELVVKGANKQLVGQVAANIRKYRQPEPYKGKGIRYSDEIIRRKEAKKK